MDGRRSSERPLLRLMLTWRDSHGIVHAVGDNYDPIFQGSRIKIFGLGSPCGLTHSLDHSEIIRADGRCDPVTCILCAAAPAHDWIDYDIVGLLHRAPCCS